MNKFITFMEKKRTIEDIFANLLHIFITCIFLGGLIIDSRKIAFGMGLSITSLIWGYRIGKI